MPIRSAQPFSAFLNGQQARLQEDAASKRNALADLQLQNAPTEIAQQNALGAARVQGAQNQNEQYSQEQQQKSLQQTAAAAARIAQSQRPREELQAAYPKFMATLTQQNPELASYDDNRLKGYMQWIAGQAQSELGVAPAQATPYTLKAGETRFGADNKPISTGPKQATGFNLSPGQTRFGPDGKPITSLPPSPTKPTNNFRALTPDEVAAAGLPAGTSAQKDEVTGKIDVLSKKDNTGVLSQKDANTAKQKLTALKVARQQLQRIKDTFATGREGTNAFGPGVGILPTEAGKKFDAAVDQMRGTLTALTRVPGVGSMSDYESKIDQGKFPARGDYEAVTEQKLQGIDDLLNTLESGYTDMLSGGNAQPASPANTAPPAAIEYLKANPNMKAAFKAKYGYLPDG